MTGRVIPRNEDMTLGCERTRRIWSLCAIAGMPTDSQEATLRHLRILGNVGTLDELRAVLRTGLRRRGGRQPCYEFAVDARYRLRFEWRNGAALRVILC